MFKFPVYTQSIATLHHRFKYAFHLTGLCTFATRKNGNEATIATRQNKAFLMLQIVAQFTLMLVGLYWRLSMFDTKYNYTYYACALYYGFSIGTAMVTAMSFLCESDIYVKFIQRLDEFNEELAQLQIKGANTFLYLFVQFQIFMGFLYGSVLYMQDRALSKRLLDTFVVAYPMAIRLIVLYLPIAALITLLQRCRAMNQCLEKLDDDMDDDDLDNDDLDYDDMDNMGDSDIRACRPNMKHTSKSDQERSAAYVLMKVTEFHAHIVEMCEQMKAIFSTIIFANILANIAQLSFAVLSYNYGEFREISVLEFVIIIIFYTGEGLMLYVTCFLLEVEAKNILITLGQLNIFYSTPELALMKNTFLLQGLHSKINFNLFSVIDLKPSTFLKQIDICKTIVLLLAQYNRKYDTNNAE